MSEQTDYLQDNRYLKIATSLGPDALTLVEVEGRDVISAPFVFHIHFFTNETDSAVLALLGQSATLSLCCTADAPEGRPINGIFRKLSGPGFGIEGFRGWRAEIVPQIAFLAYTADCRIFQNLTVVDIVTSIFHIHGILKFQFRNLMGTYPVLDYCVQYRESGLNFISRLMEHYGLYYWFEHVAGAHTMIIADSVQAAKPVSPDPLVMSDQDRGAPIQMLEAEYSFRPGTWTIKDYDFTAPDSPMKSTNPTVITQAPLANYEIFEYPGSYADASSGDKIARLRIEQEESQFNRVRGAGNVVAFNPGFQATIEVPDGTGHEESKLLLVEVYHHASDMTHVASGGGAPTYGNEFSGVPTKYNFRPARVSSKPFVQGVQTAKVTGPPGQTIYTDPHGRVKVRFHWDRNPDGGSDQTSSCWLRVSQIWSSGTGGGIQVPRIGEEVIVDFLEGDPDRPIITGRVYNGNNVTPYGLPGNSTQFGFKTQSVAAGGGAAAAGFNELRFEDSSGSEEIFVQAQKDYNRKVLNDENDTIGGNVVRGVTGNVTHTTTGNHDKTVQSNETKTVGGTYAKTVTGNVTNTHSADVTVNTTGSHTETVATSHTFTTPAATWTVTDWFKNLPSSEKTVTPLMISLINVNMGVYGTTNTVTGSSLQIFGVNVALNAVNQATSGLNSTVNGADLSTNGMETKDTVAAIHTAATKIKTAAMDVGNYVMKLIS
jgi:type VI secretion system secreted protein VgrG